MPGFGEFLRRSTAWFSRSHRERELREELESHIALRTEQNIVRGLAPEEARRQALVQFGNPSLLREEGRSAWGYMWLETLLLDVRYALRMLRKTPAFTAVVVLTLALGIGVNTAIFSAINAVMLRLLPVPQPEQLVLLNWSHKEWPKKVLDDLEGSSFRDKSGKGSTSYSFSTATYDYVQQRNDVFSETFAFAANSGTVNIGLNGRADSAGLQGVSGNFFAGLGVSAMLGRALLLADDAGNGAPVTVVSYSFWSRKMGRDPSVLDKAITVNGTPLTVIGVMPPDFFGIEPGEVPDLWVPLNLYAFQAAQGGFEVRTPKVWWTGILGRLKPGETAEHANAQLGVLFRQSLAQADANLADADIPQLELVPAARGLNQLRRRFSDSLLLLMAMVGVILLITCSNVAGLLLARATARRKEIAIRASLGAARTRIVRQLLTESVLLALLGGVAGVLLARWAGAGLVALLAGGRTPVEISVAPDLRVLAFTAAVSILSGVLFGLAPALRATRLDVFDTLKQVAASGLGGSRRFLSGKLLVGAQVALSLVLVMGAGLLLGTLRKLEQLDIGFDRTNLVSFRVQPGLNGYKDQRLADYYAELQRRLAAIPGVRSVTLSQLGPIASGSSSTAVAIPGFSEPGKRVNVYRHSVGPRYFSTLGLPILLGRPLGEQDNATTAPVAVVNQKFVAMYMRGENPVGHTFEYNKRTFTIVGLAKDAKYARIREEAPPTMYLSYLQPTNGRFTFSFLTYLLRTEGDPRSVYGAIQREVLATDKDVPLSNLHTETELIDQVLFLERTFALLSSVFGGLALLLVCVGLYGTIGYTVAQRTNEIGIRMALGARPGSILGMFLGDTVRVVATGLLIGIPLALFATRLLTTQLYDLSPHDPATIALAIATLLAVTVIAGFIPSRRAAHVDPMVALRYE